MDLQCALERNTSYLAQNKFDIKLFPSRHAVLHRKFILDYVNKFFDNKFVLGIQIRTGWGEAKFTHATRFQPPKGNMSFIYRDIKRFLSTFSLRDLNSKNKECVLFLATDYFPLKHYIQERVSQDKDISCAFTVLIFTHVQFTLSKSSAFGNEDLAGNKSCIEDAANTYTAFL